MYDGVMDDIRTCVRLGIPKRVPVFALSEEFDVKWYGRYAYEEICQDGDKMAEVWTAATEEFDYDWVWLQVDDCFEFEPLGVGCVRRGEHPPGDEGLPSRRPGRRCKRSRSRIPSGTDGCRRSSKRSEAPPEALRRQGLRRAAGPRRRSPSACLLFGLTEALMMIHTDAGPAPGDLRFLRRAPERLGRGPARGRAPMPSGSATATP